MGSSKGQVWSYDLIVAVVAFILVLAFLVFFWWSVSATVGMPRGERLMDDTLGMADILLSPGNPSDWNDTVNASDPDSWAGASLFGLMENFTSPRISQDKAAKLLQMNATNYSALRAKFRSNYHFYVEMKEFYNCSNASAYCAERGIPPSSGEYSELEHYVAVSGQNFTLGIPPSSGGARSVAIVNRFAVYNSSLVRLKVILWTNQTWQ